MMHDNARWAEFRAQLKARGVTIQWMWESRRDGKTIQAGGYRRKPRPADVGMVSFTGNGFQPSILVAVVIDYGDGFGLFIDDSPKMTDDVERIATPRAGV